MKRIIKNILILAAIFLVPMLINAQDSSNYLSNDFLQRYRFFTGETISQSLLPLTNYATLEAGFKQTGGEYKLAQDGSKQNDIFFRTSGTKKVDKYLVSGGFSYERTTLDSVGYTLRYGLNEAVPFYFYAAKKGNWLASRYKLNGIVSRPISANEKWTAGAGINYQALNAWRNSDPRPEYFTYLMQVDGTINYKIASNQTVGIQGSYIRKNIETSVEFRNDNYKNSTFYPDYNVYLQHGYGYGELRGSGGSLYLNTNTKGWQLQGLYNGRFAFGDVTIKGGYTDQTSDFQKPASSSILNDADSMYGKFYEKIWNASLYWKKNTGNNYWSLLAAFNDHVGKDYNSLLGGNNYVYSAQTVTVQPSFGHYKNGLIQYEIAVDGGLSSLLRADGSTDQRAEYQYATAGATFAYYWHPQTGHIFKTQLHGGAQLPVSAQINRPDLVSGFSKNVAYADYYFYNENSINGGVELQYSFPVQKVSTFVKAAGQYTNAYTRTDGPPATSRPGTNRWWWQLSIGVNL